MTKSKKPAGIRIPAPVLTIIHITMAILLGRLVPLPIPAPAPVQWLGLGFAALGFVLGVLTFIEFKRARTALDPKKPANGFVTTGIFRYTRNPTYLGFVFMLIGLPLTMGVYWGIILAWSLITFMNNMVIKYEEITLEIKYKQQYLDYSAQVRRWL